MLVRLVADVAGQFPGTQLSTEGKDVRAPTPCALCLPPMLVLACFAGEARAHIPMVRESLHCLCAAARLSVPGRPGSTCFPSVTSDGNFFGPVDLLVGPARRGLSKSMCVACHTCKGLDSGASVMVVLIVFYWSMYNPWHMYSPLQVFRFLKD